MGVIDTVKDVVLMVQKVDNIDLVKRILEMQQQVFTLVEENRDLKDKNRALQETLTTREQMVFRKNAYWKGDDGPFCPQCFDAGGLAMRMLITPGFVPQCPKCHTSAPDPDREPAKPVRRVRSGFLNRGGY
jgi:hypothetical protein